VAVVAVTAIVLSRSHARAAEEADRAATVKLRAEVAQALQGVDDLQQGLAQQVSAADAKVKQLQASDGAFTAGHDADRIALARARDELASLRQVDATFQAEIAGASGAKPLHDRLATADAAIGAGHVEDARKELHAIRRDAATLASVPASARQIVLDQRAAFIARLGGKWAEKPDCKQPYTWTVADGGASVQIALPGAEPYQEDIVQAADGLIVTEGVKPLRFKGHFTEYQPGPDSLEVHFADGKAPLTLSKCP
jgi:hypothetical protein